MAYTQDMENNSTYLLSVPNKNEPSRYRSNICHRVSSAVELAALLPRNLAKNAEAIHRHVITCLGNGSESVTIQASPYIEASPEVAR